MIFDFIYPPPGETPTCRIRTLGSYRLSGYCLGNCVAIEDTLNPKNLPTEGRETITMPQSYMYDPAEAAGVQPVTEQEIDHNALGEQRLENAAEGLQQRREYGYGMNGNPALELQLSEVQQQLSRETDPIKAEALNAKATQLASQIVSADQNAPEKGSFKTEEEIPDLGSQLRARYGDDTVNETLAWAGETFNEETSNTINELFASGHAATTSAYEAISYLKSNPSIVHNSPENHHIDEVTATNLIHEFGEHGNNLVTINAAICNGIMTRGQAVEMVATNPALMKVAFAAAQRGLISFAV